MKRIIVLITACLVFQMTHAQTKTFVGVKAGVGLSTAFMQHSVYPIINEIGWKPGFHGGIQLTHFPFKYKARINAAIQIGVNYNQKGWVQKFVGTDEPDHHTRINYLEIPFEAVGYFGGENKYYVSAGFFVEYALSASVDDTPASAIDDPEIAVQNGGISDFYRYSINQDHRLGYGPRGAVGVFRETDIGVFRLEAFLSFTVRSTFDFEPVDSGIPDLSLQYGAGLTLGYYFSFGDLEL
jgi:hypothetical protein